MRDTTNCTQDWTPEKETTKHTNVERHRNFSGSARCGQTRLVSNAEAGKKRVVFSGSSELCLEHVAERDGGDGHWTSLEFD